MISREFMDGIAFYENENEIAFYSNVTDRITWYQADDEYKCAYGSVVKADVCLEILHQIEDYINQINQKDKMFSLGEEIAEGLRQAIEMEKSLRKDD